MSSEITMENDESSLNTSADQPHKITTLVEKSSDDSNVDQSGQYSNISLNLEEEGNLLSANSDSMLTETREEEVLVEKVNKLDLDLRKEDTSKAGAVVQNKLSECLSYLKDYESDDSSDSDNDEIQEAQMYQGKDVVSETDTDSEVYDTMDEFYEDSMPNESQPKNSKKEDHTKTSWMMDLGINTNMPTVPDISSLELNNKEEFLHIGNIDCIVDKFVTIEGLPGVPAYDLDTLLFLEEGSKVLGYVLDVMGPVSAPIYVVNVDSLESINSLQLKKGTKIFSAPKSKYTKYVFVHELMKIRGSDASWVGDAELPPEFQEFSDDEAERQTKAKNKLAKRKHGSLERHQEFETNMNKINHLNSRLHKMLDNHKTSRQHAKDSRQRKDNQKSAHTSLSSNPPRVSKEPPAAPQYETPNLPFEGSQNLQAYLQNCTSQFMNQWRPHPINFPPLPPPQAFIPPPEQYYNPTSVPCPIAVFDPSVPPPNCGGALSSGGSPVPPNLSLLPPPTNQGGNNAHINGSPAFRQPNRPGPSNGYGF